MLAELAGVEIVIGELELAGQVERAVGVPCSRAWRPRASCALMAPTDIETIGHRKRHHVGRKSAGNGNVIARSMKVPKGSCFLLGPRGTGKSTWIEDELPNALRIDLLDQSTSLSSPGTPNASARWPMPGRPRLS